MSERITQIAAAPEGWRVVDALLGFAGDVTTASDDDLLAIAPVACFALLQPEFREDAPFVMPIIASDWPAYLYPEDGGSFGHSKTSARIDILGPGQEIRDLHRDEARERINEFREAEKQAIRDEAEAEYLRSQS